MIRLERPRDPKWLSGNGSPEGVVFAVQGAVFVRLDGDAGELIYVMMDPQGLSTATGWIAKV